MRLAHDRWNNLSTPGDWRAFLLSWSDLLLQDPAVVAGVEERARAARWLGVPGASEGHLSAVETQLGVALPPSYRVFLAVTDGWSALPTGAALNRLRSASRLAWFVEENRGWVDMHLEFFAPDEPEQQLAATLQISDVADSAVLLLNPRAVDADGEWEGWFFAPWAAGINSYPSFKALLLGMYEATVLDAQRRDARGL